MSIHQRFSPAPPNARPQTEWHAPLASARILSVHRQCGAVVKGRAPMLGDEAAIDGMAKARVARYSAALRALPTVPSALPLGGAAPGASPEAREDAARPPRPAVARRRHRPMMQARMQLARKPVEAGRARRLVDQRPRQRALGLPPRLAPEQPEPQPGVPAGPELLRLWPKRRGWSARRWLLFQDQSLRPARPGVRLAARRPANGKGPGVLVGGGCRRTLPGWLRAGGAA